MTFIGMPGFHRTKFERMCFPLICHWLLPNFFLYYTKLVECNKMETLVTESRSNDGLANASKM